MTHLTDEQFQRLTDGGLEDEQSEALWHHLDGCEICLDRLNQRLEERTVPLALGEETVISTHDFQGRLMRRINREEATRAVVNFGYNGLSTVFTLLVKSVFAIRAKKPAPSE